MKTAKFLMPIVTLLAVYSGFTIDFNPDTNDVFTGLKGPVKSCTYKSVKNIQNPDEFHFETRLGGNRAFYDAEGKIIQRIFFKNDGKKTVHHYFYDRNDNLVRESWEHANGGKSKVIYTYDDQNRLIEEVRFDRIRYKYKYKKNIIFIYLENIDVPGYKKIFLDRNKEIYKIEKYNTDNLLKYVKNYSFYEHGTIKLITYDQPDKKIIINTHFNEKGEVVEIIDKKENKVTGHIKYKYVEHDSYGNWTRREKYHIIDKSDDFDWEKIEKDEKNKSEFEKEMERRLKAGNMKKEVLVDIEIRELEYYQKL